MHDVQQEVAKRLDDYADAFLKFEPEGTLPYFNVPMIFISDRGVDTFTSEHDLLAFLKLYVMVLQQMEYDHVELGDRNVIVLNENHALTTFTVTRYDASNSILGQFEAKYAFRNDEGHWKIVVAILLASETRGKAALKDGIKKKMANETYSELDPMWPPKEPATGFAADALEYLIRKRTDGFFGFLRWVKPNLALGKTGPVFITRFRDVQEALDRPEVFQVTYRPMMDPSVGPFMLGRDGTVYNQRDKGIMRSLIQRKDLHGVRKTVARLARQCIEEGASNGELEVVGQLSRKAPVMLNGEYFGFPAPRGSDGQPDLKVMMKWGRDTQYDMFHNQKMSGKVHDDNIIAGHEMQRYIRNELIPEKRAEIERCRRKGRPMPGDIVSRMLQLELPDDVGFTIERMVANIIGLLVGHIETTSAAIVQTLDQLLERPGQLAGARAAIEAGDDHLFYRYCWEALRFNPINPFVVRICVEDYRLASGTWRNRKIKSGSVVLVCTRSAMKDGREVPRPGQFRLDRPDHHYMHLGYGLHRCLGDHVSKVQVPEIIKALVMKENLRKVSEIDMAGGPFPERFVVAFDR